MIAKTSEQYFVILSRLWTTFGTKVCCITLEEVGIKSTLHHWSARYLSNRKQGVLIIYNFIPSGVGLTGVLFNQVCHRALY